MMKTVLITFSLVGLIAVFCLAGSSRAPEGMVCQQATVVTYHAGPHWDAFAKHVDGHLAFLQKGMDRGKVLFAGPFVSDKGGLTVYDMTDLTEVDTLVGQDPLVANKVVTYTLKSWSMCSPAEKVKP